MHHVPKIPRIPRLQSHCIYICCGLTPGVMWNRLRLWACIVTRVQAPSADPAVDNNQPLWEGWGEVFIMTYCQGCWRKIVGSGPMRMSLFDDAVCWLIGRFPSRWRSACEWSSAGEEEGSCWVMEVEGAEKMRRKKMEFLKHLSEALILHYMSHWRDQTVLLVHAKLHITLLKCFLSGSSQVSVMIGSLHMNDTWKQQN